MTGDLQRARLLRAIHAEARRLGIDDDTRRAMQMRLTGRASCAEMNEHELRRVLDSMHRKRGKASEDRLPLIRKIYALLGDRSVAYAEGILRHMFGEAAPHHLEWATPTQLRKVVAALEYDRRRRACR